LDKLLATKRRISEVKAAMASSYPLFTEGDHLAPKISDHVIEVPTASELMALILETVPLQLLAYHIAVRRGCDVDQPRNLTGTITDRETVAKACGRSGEDLFRDWFRGACHLSVEPSCSFATEGLQLIWKLA
jgi:hypothetical protein